MPDEADVDDQVLYDVWDHVTADEAAAAFERLAALRRAVVRLHGADPSPALVAIATELRDGPLRLGHLPTVRQVLASL